MTSWQQPAVQMDYRWYKHVLTYLQRGGTDANAEQVTLRFSHRGQVTFMQRQFAGVRQSLSQQEVSDYQLTAEQELNKSRRLILQQITLGQGEWLGNNTVAICQQSPAKVAFSAEQQQIINHQSTQRRVFVAWLNTTEGRQLLMITGQNLCQSQPSQDNL